MPSLHNHLHELEQELIQMKGLMVALQKLLPDNGAHMYVCMYVAKELEERIKQLEKRFYVFWEVLLIVYRLDQRNSKK